MSRHDDDAVANGDVVVLVVLHLALVHEADVFADAGVAIDDRVADDAVLADAQRDVAGAAVACVVAATGRTSVVAPKS